MTDEELERIRRELLEQYPDATIVVAENRTEVIAELERGRAVAVIEASQPHFHAEMTETYRSLKGRLHVACAGTGYVLEPDQTLTILPGQVHHARATDEPAWIEVQSDPPWSPDDHFTL